MQRIVDLLATAGTSETVTKIQNLLDGFKAAGQVRPSPHFRRGRSMVLLNDGQNTDKTIHRLIRLRFAKKMLPGRVQITPANLVSSMAEFSLIYDQTTKIWHFGM